MQEHKNFRDRNAGRYDRLMRKDWAAYSSRENEGVYDDAGCGAGIGLEEIG